MKKGAMMLAAVETVANADPVRGAYRHDPDFPAQATARVSVHAASPRGSRHVGRIDLIRECRRFRAG
ncbi:conserved hypothetical protein [Sinorhizobium medicae]|uniref:Uncharacterized protein n=1 Tax=Sinorhizobium medicae TaxID=110321 RepID=A0A508WXI8_9HYPH|nr:conserved hypothetical protein [Sinorhizobium medicae]